MQIASAVNSFGVSAMAGNSASQAIESMLSAVSTSGLGGSASTFIGQNLGAKKPERVKKIFFWCITLGTVSTLILGVILYHTGAFWLRLTVPDDPLAVEYGLIRMSYMVQLYFLAAIGNILSNSLSAYGRTVFCSLQSLLCVCGFRAIWMWFIYPQVGTFHCVIQCYIVTKILMAVTGGIYFAICYRRMKKGRFDAL
jgi:Na+-driven multidrug efflux pump